MNLKNRFWARVNKNPNGCWLWTGPIFADNRYGQISVNGSPARAHRVSWVIHHGPIPDGLLVLHRCDCRICVRPDHLWLGTHRDNVDDMVLKGRSLRGERNHNAKITSDQVLEIRSLYHTGNFSQCELAARFGIRQPQVSAIILLRSWSHL